MLVFNLAAAARGGAELDNHIAVAWLRTEATDAHPHLCLFDRALSLSDPRRDNAAGGPAACRSECIRFQPALDLQTPAEAAAHAARNQRDDEQHQRHEEDD